MGLSAMSMGSMLVGGVLVYGRGTVFGCLFGVVVGAWYFICALSSCLAGSGIRETMGGYVTWCCIEDGWGDSGFGRRGRWT